MPLHRSTCGRHSRTIGSHHTNRTKQLITVAPAFDLAIRTITERQPNPLTATKRFIQHAKHRVAVPVRNVLLERLIHQIVLDDVAGEDLFYRRKTLLELCDIGLSPP